MTVRHERPTIAKGANPLLVEVARVTVGGTTREFDDVVRIGSHPSNEIVLEDPTVSRFHCRIAREGGGWRIADLGSKNGTRVDGVRVITAELERSATLTLGNTSVQVKLGASTSDPPSKRKTSFGSIVGDSAVMQKLYAILERVAQSEIDVLVHGESGTGKELVATELIQRSSRAEKPIVVVDCGAINPSLIESELFGHVRGAFTGADREREGAFEAADGGTLFLDEVGELPLELQPKLLRALEAREVRRVGQNRPKRVEVRVIAATNRDLEPEVNRGRFREDLYYRLAKLTVRVPPLRDRLEDIPLLVQTFTQSPLPDAVIEELQLHDWPGNVRELRNYVERWQVVGAEASLPARSGQIRRFQTPGGTFVPEGIPDGISFKDAKEAAITDFEKAFLSPLLERCDGNFSKAARTAKMDRMYLHQLAQKHGLVPKKK